MSVLSARAAASSGCLTPSLQRTTCIRATCTSCSSTRHGTCGFAMRREFDLIRSGSHRSSIRMPPRRAAARERRMSEGLWARELAAEVTRLQCEHDGELERARAAYEWRARRRVIAVTRLRREAERDELHRQMAAIARL